MAKSKQAKAARKPEETVQQPTPPAQEGSEEGSDVEFVTEAELEKDEAEEELERLVFGDSEGFREGLRDFKLDDDEAEVELARLVVAPDRRGRGIRRRLAAALVEQARRHHPAVFLRVHPDNAAALRSYAGAGFVPVDEAEAAAWNEGQPVPYVWRRHAG